MYGEYYSKIKRLPKFNINGKLNVGYYAFKQSF